MSELETLTNDECSEILASQRVMVRTLSAKMDDLEAYKIERGLSISKDDRDNISNKCDSIIEAANRGIAQLGSVIDARPEANNEKEASDLILEYVAIKNRARELI